MNLIPPASAVNTKLNAAIKANAAAIQSGARGIQVKTRDEPVDSEVLYNMEMAKVLRFLQLSEEDLARMFVSRSRAKCHVTRKNLGTREAEFIDALKKQGYRVITLNGELIISIPPSA